MRRHGAQTRIRPQVKGRLVYLRDHDVAVRCSAPLDEAVQDVLRDLSGFPAARRSPDDHHRAFVDGRHDLLLELFDGQLLALRQDLNDSIV